MKKTDIVNLILGDKPHQAAVASASVFAPSNIALCKYWGKRDSELNLPVNSSLSVSLADRGAETEIAISQQAQDQIYFADQALAPDHPFAKRLMEFLDLFRFEQQQHFVVRTNSNVPVAAGLASSASGFASVVKALNQLFNWQLSSRDLSILARLGSGSASRSIESGFCLWHRGEQADGMDSYAEKLAIDWPELCVGILILDDNAKKISSRKAMQQTVDTSTFYQLWPQKSGADLTLLQKALQEKRFDLFGEAAESNALAMHACMQSAKPAVIYSQPATLAMMNRIWQKRAEGLSVYFTQDAGPNLKLFFLEKDVEKMVVEFPSLELVRPFVV